MLKVKVTPIGNSLGVVLPKEALTKLRADKGDLLYLVEGPDGLTLTPYQQDFEAQMKAAETVMKKYRNALHELEKSPARMGSTRGRIRRTSDVSRRARGTPGRS